MVAKIASRGAVLVCAFTLPMSAALATELGPAGVKAESVKLESVLGRDVSTSREGDGGRIIDLLADADGRVRAAIVEFGGFLGIGTRKIAVEWSALRFMGKDGRSSILVDVSREQLRIAPEYKPNEAAVVVKAMSD